MIIKVELGYRTRVRLRVRVRARVKVRVRVRVRVSIITSLRNYLCSTPVDQLAEYFLFTCKMQSSKQLTLSESAS